MPPLRSDQSRKLMRLGREALLQGLPLPSTEQPWIGAGLLMIDKLREHKNGAAEAGTIALDLLQATLAQRTSRQRVECSRGCSYCCSSVVSATVPEIFRLARWLTANAPGRAPEMQPAAIVARAAPRSTLDLGELLRQRLPCILLIDNACSAYAARPGNCRQLLSSSKAACKADFEGVPTRIPVVDEAMQKAAHVRALLLAAVAAVGLSTTSYELSQALSLALRDPLAEARWLAGEDVFANINNRQELGPMTAAVEHWLPRLTRAT